jgi:hypothetical protein
VQIIRHTNELIPVTIPMNFQTVIRDTINVHLQIIMKSTPMTLQTVIRDIRDTIDALLGEIEDSVDELDDIDVLGSSTGESVPSTSTVHNTKNEHTTKREHIVKGGQVVFKPIKLDTHSKRPGRNGATKLQSVSYAVTLEDLTLSSNDLKK